MHNVSLMAVHVTPELVIAPYKSMVNRDFNHCDTLTIFPVCTASIGFPQWGESMRLRALFIIAILFSALAPSLVYGWWAYRDGVKHEFAEVSDRHLLLAHNLSNALERYYVDLVAITESVAIHIQTGHPFPNVEKLLAGVNIQCAMIVDANTGKVISRVDAKKVTPGPMDPEMLKMLRSYAVEGKTVFTPVSATPDGTNVIYAVRMYGDTLSFSQINTKYFIQLGKSISFGKKGHAAIVDNEGNVLAHPLPDWVKTRKNIAKVSAVKRMLNGETGIEQFYSPALKGDMIAGIAAIPGPGWGVMIPQPVSELYEKVAYNNQSLMLAIFIAVMVTGLLVMFLLRAINNPVQSMSQIIQGNSKGSSLKKIILAKGMFSIREFEDFQESYNAMIDRLGKANDEISEMAFTDSITKLPNRHQFQQEGKAILSKAAESGSGGILLFIDIDNFKMVNDLFGHEAGDGFLAILGKALEKTALFHSQIDQKVRNGICDGKPIVSRIGGDEFTIIMPGLTSKRSIEQFLKSVLKTVQTVNDNFEHPISCGASIGCAVFDDSNVDLVEYMRQADIAMYEAKKSGKNCYRIFDSNLGMRTENEIRAEFANAIENGQLTLEYQPKICQRRKVVAGVEGLIRWNHPVLGRLSPDAWLPAIAKSHAGKELSNWVIRTSMQDMKTLHGAGYKLTFAINISSEQLCDPALPGLLEANLAEFSVDPRMFEIEVTEDSVFENEEKVAGVLAKIHNSGIAISIDDFGTGYSNLARLAGLPIDYIKLDKSLMSAGPVDPRVRAILEATVSMANSLDCKIIAEGIETVQMAQFAEKIGVHLLQGYFFSKSLSLENLVRWLGGQSSVSLGQYRDIMRKAA
jgi:diguanylate cyclase (GGDEF)-like protein